MGLASALTTALTGLTAAETQIDVVGNNLSNAQTVGFKASGITFATQFLQTHSLGSAPTSSNGGTNPRQIGLGTQVAEITPNFTQGTIEISSNPSDLAIQGDGFFIVDGGSGEQLFTRNGIFKTNSSNELVTATGNRLLGFGVDQDFTIEETLLKPITIPLGEAAVAQPTSNVTLEGTLTPTGDVADTAEVIQSAVLGDSSVPQASNTGVSVGVASTPSVTGVTVANIEGGGGTHAEGSVYQYKYVYVDSSNTESAVSSAVSVTVPAGNTNADNTITLNNLPPATGDYNNVRVYRTAAGGSNFFLLGSASAGGSYVDDNNTALSSTALDETSINGNYSYLVTYHTSGAEESRPSPVVGPLNVVDGRIQLRTLPTPPTPGSGDTFPAYDQVRIYRNLATNSDSYYLVDTVAPGSSYTDSKTDAEISNLATLGNKLIDLDGPKINGSTLLTDVVKRSGFTSEAMFEVGELTYGYRKGGRALDTKDFTIASTTTVQELVEFMEDAMGIFDPSDDPLNSVPTSLNTIAGETGTLSQGGSITNGRLRFVSNNGEANALEIDLSSFTVNTSGNTVLTPNLSFGSIQEGKGQGTVADFVVFDSLGIPLNVRVTAVLETRTGSATTYRWFAESAQNDPLTGSEVSVGTGLVTFDGEGSYVSNTNNTVAVERRNFPSSTPLQFDLDFSKMSGLSANVASMSASKQNGSAAGTLTSYVVGEEGLVRGVFSNGNTRDLGQIRLAKFSNPAGLEQRGQNMFASGVNAGISFANPGVDGSGKLVAGAVELSNTDIGKNLIDLVLATTLYRGNTRVVTTSQQLLDELLNLRR